MRPDSTRADATRWCPHCRKATSNAPLPQLADDAALLRGPSRPSDPATFPRRHYCEECLNIWQSVEAPKTFVESLLAAREEAESLKRQIATLRLLLAHERRERRQNESNDAAA